MDPNHPAVAVELVAGDFLLTVNPVDGCEIVSCPPGRRPISPRRASQDRPQAAHSTAQPPLLERQEERHRLSRLLARGRSVRLTGAPGSGRSALLDAAARDCADLAPDGVIRLSGHRRTAEDLQHELYAAVHHAPRYRPGRTERTAALREIGAVVVLDDIEFGGTALDELLDATPECAFLISAHPGVPAPASGSRLEEVFLPGLSRTACLELLEYTAGRRLGEAEADWAADLWLATEGAPVRAVQAGTLLRLRGGEALPEAAGLAAALAAALPDGAREIVRLAVALGGELPGAAHLAELTGEPRAADAHAELLGSGLVTATGSRYRLSAATAADLAAAGYADGGPARAFTAAQHFTRWLAEPGIAAEEGAERSEMGVPPAEGWGRADAEAEVLLAVAQAAQRGGHPHAVTELARTAAPLLAVALRWSAWERMLRNGGESARTVGDIARQAYFHHELGVLAICQGRLDRARAELEASTALRGVLADASGAMAGRRALTLVEDLSHPPALPPTEQTMRLELPTGAESESGPGAGTVAAAPPGSAAPPEAGAAGLAPGGAGGAPGPSGQPEPSGPAPMPAPAAAGSEDPTQALPRQVAHHAGEHRAPSRGRRRNLAAAASGTLLVVVLGTVVALGLTSDGDDEPANDDRADPTLADPDAGPQPAPTTPSERPTSPSVTASASDTSPGTTTEEESATPEPTTAGPTTPASPTDPTSEPTTPSGRPTETGSGGVSPTPSEPDPTPTDPDPTPTETDPEPTPTETETGEPSPTGTATATETETSTTSAPAPSGTATETETASETATATATGTA
jgi:hypothetical protein